MLPSLTEAVNMHDAEVKPEPEIDIITADEAAAILGAELASLEAEGWITLVQTDYMARLTRGQKNLDIRVDLLGGLEREEKPLSLVQTSGQMIGWLFVVLALLMGLIVASSLGLVPF